MSLPPVLKNKPVVLTGLSTVVFGVWRAVDEISNVDFLLQKIGLSEQVAQAINSPFGRSVCLVLSVIAFVLSGLIFLHGRTRPADSERDHFETSEDNSGPETETKIVWPKIEDNRATKPSKPGLSFLSRHSKRRIWKHPSGLTESVKIGWSWPAFLFGPLWAIAKGMILVGICMFLGAMAVRYAIVAIQADEEDFLLVGTSIVLGLVFGAKGNSLREWHLRRRGFVLSRTASGNPFIDRPVKTMRTFWHNSAWGKVSVVIGLLAIVAGGIYVLKPQPSVCQTRVDSPHHFFTSRCDRATINGCVEFSGEEAFAWFEWGDTPDLGRTTVQQRFSVDSEFYQDLIGLAENTTYFYKAVGANEAGEGEGRVKSFTTARCEKGTAP